jgi:cell division septation protein DedD
VQVAAISSRAAITSTVAKIRKAGFTAYQVEAGKTRTGATLVKVQAGPFATREAAVAQVAKLKQAVGGAPFVVATP